MFVLGGTPDEWSSLDSKSEDGMDIGEVRGTMNKEHIVLGHVGGVELVHVVVLVAILLVVLLRGGLDMLHAVSFHFIY